MHLSGALYARWVCHDQSRTLIDWVERTVRAWAQFIIGAVDKPIQAPILEHPENFDHSFLKD